MNNSVLNDLLKQYEKTRLNNIHDLEKRKKELYLSNPKLQEIDDKLSNISINTAKSILQKNSSEYLNTLKIEIENLKNEKLKILKSIGLSEDFLSPKYECKICKDTGYVFENGKTVMCNCLKQKIYNIEYNQKNENFIKNQTFNNFNINLFSDEINSKKYNSKIFWI